MKYTMKTIPAEFTESGFTHRQLAREGRVALFERTKGKAAPHFEVVIIGSHNGYEIKTVTPPVKIAPAETYPTATAWGSKGWTFTDKHAAEMRFHSLLTHVTTHN